MAQHVIPAPQKLERIRVLAADSTRMGSQLLAQALAQDEQFHVTGVEPKSPAILSAVAEQRPHVVLMSSLLEDSATQGFDVTRQLCAGHPETRVILLMDTSNASAVVEAFRCGARGVFSRTESSAALAKCISSVHHGQVWANSAELRYVIEALRESEPVRLVDAGGQALLSKREQDVVRCVAEGLSNREIATALKLTEHTVKNYLFRIFDKLGVSSRVEVVLYVFRLRKAMVGFSSSDEPEVGAPEAQLLSRSAKAGSKMAPTPVEPVRELARRTRG
ncbi:MAG: response regulator transcription factor [Candidatus Sulfotelmatobacter sp.]|jgi:two-component system nitrate/nitrite response regulator NarL